MTTPNQNGGIFGRDPIFDIVQANLIYTDGAQINGNCVVVDTLTVGTDIILDGQSLGGLSLQGTWNADTNVPDLTAITPDNNQFWIVSDSGDTTLGPISSWAVNDWAVYINDAWTKISGGDRTIYTTIDVGDMTMTGSSITVNAPATDLTLNPASGASLVVPNIIKTPQIYGTAGSGTGDLILTSGGTTTMSLAESGNVGISQPTPVSSLQVSGAIDASPASSGVHLGMTTNDALVKLSGSTGGQVDFQDGTDASQFSGRIAYTHASDTMTFFTNGSQFLSVNSAQTSTFSAAIAVSGNINSTNNITATGNLTTGSNLTVTGAASITGNTTSDGEYLGKHLRLGRDNSGIGDISVDAANDGMIRITGGSNTSNSGGRIDLIGPTATTNAGKTIFRNGTSGEGSTNLVIHDDGKVSILKSISSTPNGELDVKGSLSITNSTDEANYWNFSRAASGALVLLERTIQRYRLESSGQMTWIGASSPFDTSPNQSGLQAYYELDQGIATIGAYRSTGSSILTFHTNTASAASTEKMRISNTGSIGMGVQSPAFTLDVASTDTVGGYGLRLRSNGTAGACRLQFTNSTGTDENAYIEAQDSDNLYLQLIQRPG